MELTASSIDGFLAYWCGLNDVSGEIHSVFQHALNIKTAGGQLVSILSQADVNGPNTVVAQLPRGVDFISMGLRSGMPAQLGGREVQLGGGTLNVKMNRARKWWPRLASGIERLDMGHLSGNLRALGKRLSQRHDHQGLGVLLGHVDDIVQGRWQRIRSAGHGPLVEQALPGIRNLVRGSLGRNTDQLARGVSGLLGLGAGSTPSGDDLLLGYVGTLSIVSRRVGGPEMEDLVELIRSQLNTTRHRTTFISSSLLTYACAGRISTPILDVIRALLFDDGHSVLLKVRALLRQGKSSGSEALLGILLALSLLPRLEER